MLKNYLEVELKSLPRPLGPKNIIRESTKQQILTERQGNVALEMLDNRKITSHLYREEIAEQISVEIPRYRDLMKHVLKTLGTFE